MACSERSLAPMIAASAFSDAAWFAASAASSAATRADSDFAAALAAFSVCLAAIFSICSALRAACTSAFSTFSIRAFSAFKAASAAAFAAASSRSMEAFSTLAVSLARLSLCFLSDSAFFSCSCSKRLAISSSSFCAFSKSLDLCNLSWNSIRPWPLPCSFASRPWKLPSSAHAAGAATAIVLTSAAAKDADTALRFGSAGKTQATVCAALTTAAAAARSATSRRPVLPTRWQGKPLPKVLGQAPLETIAPS
mmetsp:Transcript_63543/g.138386  ORF Transcript_63543/g.138386 Transcript_63543/m.138386 type:complete len:252 (-) Transcript_63543:50-805(-)